MTEIVCFALSLLMVALLLQDHPFLMVVAVIMICGIGQRLVDRREDKAWEHRHDGV